MHNEILNRVRLEGTDLYRDQHGQLWKKVAGIYKKTDEQPKPSPQVLLSQTNQEVTVKEGANNYNKTIVIIVLIIATFFGGRALIKHLTASEQKSELIPIVDYVESDFYWDKSTEPYKSIIVAGVNKIHRENSRCKEMDPSSAYISSNKGTASNPIFYVTCGSGSNAFNAFFSKSDVASSSKLIATKHVDKSLAIKQCENYAKSNATHPSTVDFSKLMDLAITEHPNGNTTVISSFRAKNNFNLELKYNIRCLSNASGLFEANINEAK